MNQLNKHHRIYTLFVLSGILLWTGACKKEYYKDSGTSDPHFKGTTMDYLNAVPYFFDSVAQVVKLAGWEKVFRDDTLTFFAPTNNSIKHLVVRLNGDLNYQSYDTIKKLSDIPATIWQRYLGYYMFHQRSELKDFPQIDYNLLSIYPGQGYLSWNGAPMNIGVIYNDDNGVKYVGYRQLSICYIPDIGHPMDNWNRADVASCNILTNNGVVHVLSDAHYYFGFDYQAFLDDMIIVMKTGG